MQRKSLILVHALLSIFVTIFFVGVGHIQTADAATLHMNAYDSYSVGQVFSIAVLVSADEDESVNAISAKINFPEDKLQILSRSKTDTIINLWTHDPSFTTSQLKLEGVILNPGFSEKNGKIITIQFRVRKTGNATLTFSDASVLANDGQGTEVLREAKSLMIRLVPATDKPDTDSENPEKTPIQQPEIPPPPSPEPEATIDTEPPIRAPIDQTPVNVNTPPITDTQSVSNDLAIKAMIAAIGLAILLLILCIIFIVREIRRKIRDRAVAITSNTFKELHHDLDSRMKQLYKAKGSRELTDEEEEFIEKFEKHIEEAEKEVQRELSTDKESR
ncbi:MAG: hypothetical protein K0S38_646 [Candidatus Paceibacter sp.]|jgi:hypothetical protein|nr:hypothetical protein [Candidatus Paceibacter sp.]